MNLKKITENPIVSSVIASIIFAVVQALFLMLRPAFFNSKSFHSVGAFFETNVQVSSVAVTSFLILLTYNLIKKGFRILPYNSKFIELDTKLYQQLRNELMPQLSISWLKNTSFDKSFNDDHLSKFDAVADWFDDVEYEFLIPELEILRTKLISDIFAFLTLVGVNTFPSGGNRQSIPQQWRQDEPEKYNRIIKQIHSKRDSICDNYEILMRKSRKMLKV